jgi:hypothetical protein
VLTNAPHQQAISTVPIDLVVYQIIALQCTSCLLTQVQQTAIDKLQT